MKYIRQMLIILLITFLGEILHKFIPIPIPSSIYGLIILFICLQTKIIKLEQVKETGNFLLEVMPILFIPLSVGLIQVWSSIRSIVIPIIFVSLFTMVIVMVTTGKVADLIISKDRSNDKWEK